MKLLVALTSSKLLYPSDFISILTQRNICFKRVIKGVRKFDSEEFRYFAFYFISPAGSSCGRCGTVEGDFTEK